MAGVSQRLIVRMCSAGVFGSAARRGRVWSVERDDVARYAERRQAV